MKIVYLVQTPAELSPTFCELSARAGDRLIWLTFAAPAEGALYLPTSTWTEGRNRLLAEAIERHPDFDYLVFCDDDLIFTKGSWAEWERALADWRPAIATPSYPHPLPCPDLPAHTLYNFDAMMNAFHRVCVEDGVLLPYISKYDSRSWWLSQFFLMHFANVLYKGQIAKFTTVWVDNIEHRDYPRIAVQDFEPFAEIYFREGWTNQSPARETYRFFNDLLTENYQPFLRRQGPSAMSAQIHAALAMGGSLLGSRWLR
jgi:hypothetical protein